MSQNHKGRSRLYLDDGKLQHSYVYPALNIRE